MRRLVLAFTALLVASLTIQPLFALDLGFKAVNDNLPVLGNRGVTGASARTGFLNTLLNDSKGLQPNQLPRFNTIDVGTGDFNADTFRDIASVTADDTNNDNQPDTGNLTIFLGLGDGSFQLPRIIRLVGIPVAVAATDIDLDGVDDIVIAEQGFVEVFTGFFLVTGQITSLDRFGNSGSDPRKKALRTEPGNTVVSVAAGMLDGDPVADIAVAERGAIGGTIELFLTFPNGVDFNPTGRADMMLAAVGNFAAGPAPRAITIQLANFFTFGTQPLPITADQQVPQQSDSVPDIFVATSSGIEIFETDTTVDPSNPTFSLTATLLDEGLLTGVLVTDVSNDGRNDVVVLNQGNSRLAVFLALSNALGYNNPFPSSIDPNAISFAPLNFNNDGKIDLVVQTRTNNNGAFGTLSILAGNGLGLFRPALSFNGGRSLPIFFNAKSITTGQFNNELSFDDIVAADGTTGLSPGGVLYLAAINGYRRITADLFSTSSLLTDLDLSGDPNDIVILEQNIGMVFVLMNISAQAPPDTVVIDISDQTTNSILIPTSATSFLDPVSGLNNLAITAITSPASANSTGQLIVARNDGAGNFDTGQFRQFVATSGATNLMSGDFNNDAAADLAYIDFNSNAVAVALNDGANLFLSPVLQETGGFVPVSAVLADLNDDDNLDLAVVNQGAGISGNQSLVSILLGDGKGGFRPTGSLLQVPDFAISIVGGLTSAQSESMRTMIDFNNDGFPDLAVASTRGGVNNVGGSVPSVTLLLNRPDSPGNFNVQPPIALIDDTPGSGLSTLQLDGALGGPGMISGRGNAPANGSVGIGRGGSNYLMAVGDFNADGSQDLVVSGTRLKQVNFRSSIYLLGNQTAGTVRVARPLRSFEYGGSDPTVAGADTFIATAAGNFSALQNKVPDVLHISLNGELWIDSNTTIALNHAPIVTIKREDLTALQGEGFKEIVSVGQTAMIPVTGFDPDEDPLEFRIVQTPGGDQPPPFVTVQQNGPSDATIMIDTINVKPGTEDKTFRIAVEATDKSRSGSGSRLPLTGRAYFSLVIRPNSPPVISAIPDQSVAPGETATIQLTINDKEGQDFETAVECDMGDFVSIDGTILTISPTDADIGKTTCKVTATDQFGLTNSVFFTVNVELNEPPAIDPIDDQSVRVGQVLFVPVIGSDPNGELGLKLSLSSSPTFVSLSDNGNGNGVIRISPTMDDRDGGPITVQITDAGGLTAEISFNVQVLKPVTINAALFKNRTLFINGSDFGTEEAIVLINGVDSTEAIISQSDSSIRLKGNRKKLNLVKGENELIVISEGSPSNPFTLVLK